MFESVEMHTRSPRAGTISELKSALAALRSENLSAVPDALIEEDFADLEAVADQIEVERLRRLAEIDRRRLYERDGHLSAASWLSSRFKMAWGTARCRVQVARALEHMPETRRALEEGEVSMSSVRVLAAAREADPSAFARSEAQLVQAARIHSVNDLQRVVAFWRLRVEREQGRDGEEALRKQRRLHASVSFLGMVRVDGDLDPETGETLLTALGAVLDAEARGSREEDDRTPAQRRADALGEICRQWLDLGDRRTVGGERPHLTVTVAADELRAHAGAARVESVGRETAEGSSEFDHVGPTGLESARRIACDATMMRVVMGGPSEPLDVGRRTHVVSPSMRRAVILRDRMCRFPGCDRPHPWCDAHHIVHWADGGPTAVTNVVLLCRRHHRAVHGSDGFRLSLVDGRAVFRRPDGTELAERAPP